MRRAKKLRPLARPRAWPYPPINVKRNRPKSHKRRRTGPAGGDASYTCPTCGESIVIPLDPSGGPEQQYVEDCPVCCNPNVIRVEFFDGDEPPRVWAEAE